MHVVDPLEVKVQSKPQQVCIWLWEMGFAEQVGTYDSFLIHRETKQADGNSCLTIGIAKARHILDPLSSKEEGKERGKKKDTTHSEWVHSKYNSSQLSVIMPGVNLFTIFIKHSFGKSMAKF